MKQLLNNLYWESVTELDKIRKQKLLLSERIALEKAKVKLEMIKKLLDNVNITVNQ